MPYSEVHLRERRRLKLSAKAMLTLLVTVLCCEDCTLHNVDAYKQVTFDPATSDWEHHARPAPLLAVSRRGMTMTSTWGA